MNAFTNMSPDSSAVENVIRGRRSIRRFLTTPVDTGVVRELLELAARAPSGTNVQPWRVYALAGAAKDALIRAVVEKYKASGIEAMDFDYHPKEWVDPWLSRRRKMGYDLYALLGIAKGDKEKMAQQEINNYRFFDAPVGLIFTFDRALGMGMLLDYGMFLENLMLAARARGLDTCQQLAFAKFQNTVQRTLGLPDNERIIGGMALGYADPDAPENRLRTERVPVEAFTEFRGFAA
ncbi:MAG: nitroreductase [Candidatus Accumulibacter sp.]|jgi:nitroreductase|nr:nitroreductase [Accumulibacter sp.]